MPSSKKYKLFSTTADGEKPPCAFFSTPGGCRLGDKCKFKHEIAPSAEGKDNLVTSAELGSVVSSESEPEARAGDDTGGKSYSVKSKAEEDESPFFLPGEQKKKKNRRGKRSEDQLPFANPKKKAKISSSAANKKATASNNDASPNMRPKKKKSTPPPPETKKSQGVGFRSLNLPIASFSLPESSSSTKKAKEEKAQPEPSHEEQEESKARKVLPDNLPLPASNPVGRKWRELVEKTRSHDEFASHFNFAKYQKGDQEAGISAPGAWIKAKPYGDWCASAPQAIAMDCEMCETQDPVSGKKNHNALCRISVIDVETKEVLLNSLVKPAWPVTNHRTWINGIAEEHLEKVQFTVRHAQAFMMALCSEETVILGHAVNHDLASIQMEHYCVVDSAYLFKAADSETSFCALRDLSAGVLKKEMPDTHDSVNDAETAARCLEYYLEKGGDVQPVKRLPSNKKDFGFYASQLFVHRIPKMVEESHLSKLFLTHSDVQPCEVQPIEFPENTNSGKTVVTFKSPRHAAIAFDFLQGSKVETDPSGRLQKKVYLRNQNYIRVRKMAYEKGGNKKSNDREVPRRSSSG